MLVILDTNVVMSGIYFGGVPRAVLNAWRDERLRTVVSVDILAEYRRVTADFRFRDVDFDPDDTVDVLEHRSLLVDPVVLAEPICRDPDDDKFFACALACRAPRPLIVSGDRDLLTASGYRGIEVVQPKELLHRIDRSS